VRGGDRREVVVEGGGELGGSSGLGQGRAGGVG